MFQVRSMLNFLLGMRKNIVAFILLLFLASCGDSCYDEVAISDNGDGYTEKTYSHTLSAKQKEWEDTGINLSANNNTFTIANVDGTATCVSNPNFPGQCAINYITMCDGGKKYICNDGSCNSKTLVNYCSGKSNCTNLDSCSGTTAKIMCKNGVRYIWRNNNWVETTTSCSEPISCIKSRKIMKFSYYTGTGSSAQYSTVNRDIGSCSAAEITCTDGHAYPVPSIKEKWTLIDSNIYPGDDIYLKILPPNTSSGAVMPTTSSGNASMNASSVSKDFTPNGGECPSEVRLKVTQSGYHKCFSLNNGLYTCPMCEGPGRHLSTEDPIYKTCDGSKDLTCWNVGGSGLWIKIVKNSEDCDANPTCNGDPNCIWFDQDTNSNSRLGVIDYQPQDTSGDGCGAADYSKCTNRITVRHITASNNGAQKICAKIADVPGSYDDNIGGYTIYATRKSCVAHNGRPTLVRFTEIPNMLALEYIVSGSPPSSDLRGTALTSNVTYPFEVRSDAGEGKLYIRVRDNYWDDNTGSYDVKIKYKKYATNGTISEFIEGVKNSLRYMTLDASRQFFRNISCIGDACNCVGSGCSSQYVNYIRTLLILYIAGYGFMFLLGSVEISQMDLMIRIFKIGVVLTITSENSFDFFYNNFFKLFLDGMDELISKSQSGFNHTSDSANVFSFADSMISLTLLSKTTWLKLGALLFISPMGMILAILLILGVLLFLLGLFKAVVVYLMATLVIGILILLAPIFIPFILFKPTQHLFENWLRMFVQYSLEPVLLLIGLGVLTQLAYVLFTTIINFHVCWKCMWPINFAFWPSITSAMALTDTIFCLQWFGPFGLMPQGGGGALAGLGIGAVQILIFIVIGHLMFGYDKLVQQIVLRISGGKAAQFKLSGKLGDFSSVGDAVFQKSGIRQLASAAGGKLKTKASRAMRRSFYPDTEEQSLLKTAKKVDSVREAEIKGNSRVLSGKIAQEMQNTSGADIAKLKDKTLPAEVRDQAAKDMGEKLYTGIGSTPEFGELVTNLDRLSSADVGSKVHSTLSEDASELHNALKDKDAKRMLEILKDKTASVTDKTEAMGKLSESLHKNTQNAHRVLFDPASVDARNQLIDEVGQLERVLPDTFRKGIP